MYAIRARKSRQVCTVYFSLNCELNQPSIDDSPLTNSVPMGTFCKRKILEVYYFFTPFDDYFTRTCASKCWERVRANMGKDGVKLG